jgi:hypothetical protein
VQLGTPKKQAPLLPTIVGVVCDTSAGSWILDISHTILMMSIAEKYHPRRPLEARERSILAGALLD